MLKSSINLLALFHFHLDMILFTLAINILMDLLKKCELLQNANYFIQKYTNKISIQKFMTYYF